MLLVFPVVLTTHAHAPLFSSYPWIFFLGRQDGDAAHRDSNTAPWVLVVRWWWLRGIRARQASRADEALACFRRCDKALREGGKRQRRRRCQAEGSSSSGAESEDKSGEEQEDEDEETVVLLPYCAVHPRIDLQVSIERSEIVEMPEKCSFCFAGCMYMHSRGTQIVHGREGVGSGVVRERHYSWRVQK